jgi:putative transposase
MFKVDLSSDRTYMKFCMKTSRFSESQIIAILKQAEAGTRVPELCREHGMSSASFDKWRSKYGGMDAALMTRMKELETENARLKLQPTLRVAAADNTLLAR